MGASVGFPVGSKLGDMARYEGCNVGIAVGSQEGDTVGKLVGNTREG